MQRGVPLRIFGVDVGAMLGQYCNSLRVILVGSSHDRSPVYASPIFRNLRVGSMLHKQLYY